MRPRAFRATCRSVRAVLALLLLAVSAGVRAQAPATPDSLAAPRPRADSGGRESVRDMLRSRGGLQRYLSHADSVVKQQGGPRGEHAQLLLSWDAPWGAPRARRERTPACGDSTVEDTLFLSFVPGRECEHFHGWTGQVHFRATGADTLGRWWHKESKGGANPGSLRVEWAMTDGFGWLQPFPVAGQGFVILNRTRYTATLRLVFAVAADEAGPLVPDSIYTLCRIILKHVPERGLAGCGQPVCVEWGEATLAFGPKDEPRVRQGQRFVAYGGGAALCEPFKVPRVEPWKPKAAVKR